MQLINRLKLKTKSCSELYLATDEDREGEAISWHLLELLKPSVPTQRVVFHEITPSAVKAGLEAPRYAPSHENMSELSRLLGSERSRLT